jgi:hypothetical protein
MSRIEFGVLVQAGARLLGCDSREHAVELAEGYRRRPGDPTAHPVWRRVGEWTDIEE